MGMTFPVPAMIASPCFESYLWIIMPVIGIAIVGVENRVVTTVLITYGVDCHQEESASIGVFTTFVRQVWGFIGQFW